MNNLSDRLLVWYDLNHRKLPWRSKPYPYYILVSEFMLQQTRMETVLPYFDRFLTAFPTIHHLAAAAEEDVLKQWEGLGYYRRARNLHRTAQQIVCQHSGIIPSDPDVLKSLPGIGDYVAGAIASTAYQVKTTALDGNVARILSRLDCNGQDLTKAASKRELQTRLLSLLPDDRVGDFNQALMELGALVCLPNGQPKCSDCPLSTDCCAYQTADPLDFPFKKPKKSIPVLPKTILIIRSGDLIQLTKFGSGLLEGLSAFPMLEGHCSLSEIEATYPDSLITTLPKSRHVFSHLVWDMIGYQLELPDPSGEGWVSLSQVAELTFPTALNVYRKNLLID